MKLWTERVDDNSRGIAEPCLHCILVDEEICARCGLEGRGRITLRYACYDRPPLFLPFVEATVEHPRVDAERAQHPPEPRRPHHGADAVEYDRLGCIEAVAAEGGLQLSHVRHHEELLRGGVGELALQVEKTGARNMARLERLVAGHRALGHVAAWR